MSVYENDPRFEISDTEYNAYLKSYKDDGDLRMLNKRHNTTDGIGTAVINQLDKRKDYRFLAGVKDREAIIDIIKGAAE
jgi:hypothetical protein